MEENESPNPADVGLFGADTVMACTNGFPHAIQPWLGVGSRYNLQAWGWPAHNATRLFSGDWKAASVAARRRNVNILLAARTSETSNERTSRSHSTCSVGSESSSAHARDRLKSPQGFNFGHRSIGPPAYRRK
jgi:hypothetical protein